MLPGPPGYSFLASSKELEDVSECLPGFCEPFKQINQI